MSRIVISVGGGGQRSPYHKFLFCTCGRLVDNKMSVILLSTGHMVNICKKCKYLIEKQNKNEIQKWRDELGGEGLTST